MWIEWADFSETKELPEFLLKIHQISSCLATVEFYLTTFSISQFQQLMKNMQLVSSLEQLKFDRVTIIGTESYDATVDLVAVVKECNKLNRIRFNTGSGNIRLNMNSIKSSTKRELDINK